MTSSIAISFGGYLLVLFGIAVYAWSRTANLSDYLLGGRRLGTWVTALAASASDMSGWLMLGLPGFAYAAGLGAGWMALGLLVGTWVNWRVVAGPLRRRTEALDDALTLPAYFSRRFPDYRRALNLVAAAMILGFFTFYTSSGLVAAGRLFEIVFALPYHWAVAAGALSIVLYTFFGGFLAISWADLFQGLLMLLALVVIAVAGSLALDGGFAALGAQHPELLDPFNAGDGTAIGIIALLSLVGWGLGYFGQPHIIIRFMAIRDEAALPQARRIAVSWTALCLVSALVIGIVGVGLVPGLEGATTETVFMRMAELMFHPLVTGVLLAAILAAIMSTAEAQLLVASSALTEDVYRGMIRRAADDRSTLWLGRFAVLAIAGVAWLLALNPESRVLDLVAYAWAGFGAAFGPAIILSLYWERMTGRAALAGIVTGGVTVVVWEMLSGGPGGIFELYELVPGFVFAWAAIWLTTVLRKD